MAVRRGFSIAFRPGMGAQGVEVKYRVSMMERASDRKWRYVHLMNLINGDWKRYRRPQGRPGAPCI